MDSEKRKAPAEAPTQEVGAPGGGRRLGARCARSAASQRLAGALHDYSSCAARCSSLCSPQLTFPRPRSSAALQEPPAKKAATGPSPGTATPEAGPSAGAAASPLLAAAAGSVIASASLPPDQASLILPYRAAPGHGMS